MLKQLLNCQLLLLLESRRKKSSFCCVLATTSCADVLSPRMVLILQAPTHCLAKEEDILGPHYEAEVGELTYLGAKSGLWFFLY